MAVLPLINIYIRGQIQSFIQLMKYLLGCQQRRLAFILLFRDNIDLLELWK